MEQSVSTSGRKVRAVQISCEILEVLNDVGEANLTELSERLDFSKSTIHGHLATLEQNELVVRNARNYQISLRWLDFGERARQRVDIYDIAQQEVEKLSRRSGENATLLVVEHGRGVFLYKESGENAVQTASYSGGRVPLHCTALGKAILAHLTEKEVKDIIERHGLSRQTMNTITDPAELFEELEQIRKSKIAIDHEEIQEGLRCVATPILNPEGRPYGAISISGPISRIKGAKLEKELPQEVRSAANVIEITASQL